MTKAEIELGVVLMLVGAVLGTILTPLLNRLWAYMNRPVPLTPQTKGQLMVTIAMYEAQLERLVHLNTNAKDLALYMFQIVFLGSFLLITGVLFYEAPLWAVQRVYMHNVLFLVCLIFADGICLFGISQASTLSDKKIEAEKAKVQKNIDKCQAMLNGNP
jgi:hypothetical protein